MPRLSKRFVDAIEPEAKDLFICDSEPKGFGLRVRPSGRKFYVAQRKRDGRTRRLVLGTHGSVTCEQARDSARVLLGRAEAGEDPAEERDLRRQDITVDACSTSILPRVPGIGAPARRRSTRARSTGMSGRCSALES